MEVVLAVEVLSEPQLLELSNLTSTSTQKFPLATPVLNYPNAPASASTLSERVPFVWVVLPLPVVCAMVSSTEEPVASTR